MRNKRPTKGDKRDIRAETHLTRPPRLEGVVKEAQMQPKKKQRTYRHITQLSHKPQNYSAKQRKAYHLRSRRRNKNL